MENEDGSVLSNAPSLQELPLQSALTVLPEIVGLAQAEAQKNKGISSMGWLSAAYVICRSNLQAFGPHSFLREKWIKADAWAPPIKLILSPALTMFHSFPVSSQAQPSFPAGIVNDKDLLVFNKCLPSNSEEPFSFFGRGKTMPCSSRGTSPLSTLQPARLFTPASRACVTGSLKYSESFQVLSTGGMTCVQRGLRAGSVLGITIAAESGCVDIELFFLDQGVDPNGEDGETLYLAAVCGHLHVMRLLVDRGANAHIRDDEVLRKAILHWKENVVRFLEESDAEGGHEEVAILSQMHLRLEKRHIWLAEFQIREAQIASTESWKSSLRKVKR